MIDALEVADPILIERLEQKIKQWKKENSSLLKTGRYKDVLPRIPLLKIPFSTKRFITVITAESRTGG
jgi:hypothetical protein